MKELAEFLKAERKKRNLTLKSVSEKSGISMDMLRALDEGDCDRLGSPLLVQNVVRAYCKALRIEASPLLENYFPEILACDHQREGIRKLGLQMKVLRKKRRMVGLPLFVLALVTIVICYGGMWVSEKRARLYAPPAADRILTQEDLPVELQQRLVPGPNTARKQVSPGVGQKVPGQEGRVELGLRDADKAIRDAEKNLEDAERGKAGRTVVSSETPKVDIAFQQPSFQAELSNSAEVMADDKPIPSAEELRTHKLAVEVDEKTWFQVRIDDRDTHSAMLYPGDKREWTAEKGAQVVVGNAGGIRMKWDDQPVKAPHDPGRVLRFRLPDYIKETE